VTAKGRQRERRDGNQKERFDRLIDLKGGGLSHGTERRPPTGSPLFIRIGQAYREAKGESNAARGRLDRVPHSIGREGEPLHATTCYFYYHNRSVNIEFGN
jgi:hypothetical protein